jgi:hypothetical protein
MAKYPFPYDKDWYEWEQIAFNKTYDVPVGTIETKDWVCIIAYSIERALSIAFCSRNQLKFEESKLIIATLLLEYDLLVQHEFR